MHVSISMSTEVDVEVDVDVDGKVSNVFGWIDGPV
jgi:hypothetical protein